jgi:hypothetical protein
MVLAGDLGLSNHKLNTMKGRHTTNWVCDTCSMRLLTYVKVSEPPTHVCLGRDRNSTTNNIYPLKEETK